LHIALGASLIATKGASAPEVEQTSTYARQFCAHLEDPQQLFPVLRGLWNYYLVRPELQMAQALGEQFLSLAQQAQDPVMLVAARAALGTTLFHLGAVASAQTHFAQGIALYDSQCICRLDRFASRYNTHSLGERDTLNLCKTRRCEPCTMLAFGVGTSFVKEVEEH